MPPRRPFGILLGGRDAAAPLLIKMALYPVYFEQSVFCLPHFRLLRIPPNIARATPEMLRIANHSVEVILLPQFALSTKNQIGPFGRETFPRVKNLFELPLAA